MYRRHCFQDSSQHHHLIAMLTLFPFHLLFFHQQTPPLLVQGYDLDSLSVPTLLFHFFASSSLIFPGFSLLWRKILKGHRWSHLVGFNYSSWLGLNQYILIIIAQVGNDMITWWSPRSIESMQRRGDLLSCPLMLKCWITEGQFEHWEPEEDFMEASSASPSSPGISLSPPSPYLFLVLRSS